MVLPVEFLQPFNFHVAECTHYLIYLIHNVAWLFVSVLLQIYYWVNLQLQPILFFAGYLDQSVTSQESADDGGAATLLRLVRRLSSDHARMGANVSRHSNKGLHGRRSQSSGSICNGKGGKHGETKICGSLPSYLDDGGGEACNNNNRGGGCGDKSGVEDVSTKHTCCNYHLLTQQVRSTVEHPLFLS